MSFLTVILLNGFSWKHWKQKKKESFQFNSNKYKEPTMKRKKTENNLNSNRLLLNLGFVKVALWLRSLHLVQQKRGKVSDHCHLIGKYRETAHSKCSPKTKQLIFFPVIIHNLNNSDFHLFFDTIMEMKKKYEVWCHSKNCWEFFIVRYDWLKHIVSYSFYEGVLVFWYPHEHSTSIKHPRRWR